jgi:sugar phosphate isomerase/epimerase
VELKMNRGRSRLSRRELLQRLGAAGSILVAQASSPRAAEIPVAQASSPRIRWAAGWLLWRDFTGRKIELVEALKDLKEFGADGIEFTPRPGELEAMALTLDGVSKMVRDSGLAVSGHYFSGPFLDPEKKDDLFRQAKEMFDSLKVFGAKHLVIGPPAPPPAGVNRLEAIARMAPIVNELGRRANAEGIAIGLHPHLNTLVETPEETDRFFELTDPKVVGLALDTGHHYLAGGDVLKALDKHGSRLNYLHFKDGVRPFNRPNFFPNLRELGKGEVDFPGVMRRLKALKYTGWIDVEQDFTSTTPRESCKTSMEYAHGVLSKVYAPHHQS